MDNLFVWLLFGPIVYSLQLAGPLPGLLVAGYVAFVFGFRIWVSTGVSFLVSLVYYAIVIPSDGMLGGLWIIKVAMAFYTAWTVTLLLWLFFRKRRHNQEKNDREPFGE